GPARVCHRVFLNRVGAALLTGEAVLEHEGGDAAVAAPLRQRGPLLAQAQLGVPAARTDDDGRAGRFVGIRDVGGDRRVVDVADVRAGDLPGFFLGGLGAGGS